jgi:stearoyl-CoA desaturase (delta-9 desaturase)
MLKSLRSWFDNGAPTASPETDDQSGVDWVRVVPFLSVHLACLAVIWVGWSPVAVAVGIGMYLLRAFFVTGFYHRYFSHRTFKTSRPAQFVFALLGNSAVQRGPLWWAAHHRQHHRTSDQEGDPHSPHEHSLYWAHMGWITSHANFRTRLELVPDLAKYPELRWLDRFDSLVPLLYGVFTFALGAVIVHYAPSLGTSGPQMLIWGFFISTVILFHVTCLVNSAAHLVGRQRYKTTDESRNSLIVALLTLGEGWHNNHHHYPAATRQGFYWWEIDITYGLLKVMSWLGLIWELSPVPRKVLERGRIAEAA